MAEEIEKLIVTIESNLADLVETTNKAIKQTEKSLKGLEKTATGAFGGAGKEASTFGDALKRSFTTVQGFIGIIKLLALAVTGLVLAMKVFPSLATKFGGRLGFIRDKAKQVVDTFKPAIRSIENFSASLKIVTTAVAFAGAIAAIVAAATALVGIFGIIAGKKIFDFFTGFSKAAVAANKQFEIFVTQFETLLGSAEAAVQRIQELTKFGIETPFELPEVVEASRILEVFGGAALATGDNLRLVGDIAAGVNRPFQEVAFWIGRMFDALESGRPFGEAAARLQEMGALSGVARAELERLQEEGADGAVIWAEFNEQVGTRFAGNMERLSKTLGGIQSNLVDFRQNLIRIGGEAFFEKIRNAAEKFLNIIGNERAAAVLERIAKVMGEISTTVAELTIDPLLSALENLDVRSVENLAKSLENSVGSARLLVNVLGPDNFQISSLVDIAAFAIERLNGALIKAVKSVVFIQATIAKATIQLEALASILLAGELPNIAQLAAIDTAGQEAFNDVLRETQRLFDDIQESRKPATSQTGRDTLSPLTTEATTPDNSLKRIKKLSVDLLNLQQETNDELQANEMEHREALQQILEDSADDALKARQDAANDLLELDKDIAQEQRQIFEDAREGLADLERNTNEAINDERQDFQKDEARETEDHLRDMRRLRLGFLDNLEDAVSARDAGRVRDLQRNFAREKQEREEDFSTKRGRDRQDNSERLAEIRQAEQQRSQEILNNQAQQLRELEANEMRRRQEITTSLNQQLATIQAEGIKATQEENANHLERQAILNNALDERLEAVAQELAAEDEINREGAKRILGTLTEFFGEGGQVDVLMNAYLARQRALQRLAFQFPNLQITSQTASDTLTLPVPSFAEGGSMIARRPTLAMFGERGPEQATFTPLNQMDGGGGSQQLNVNISGSAPPGIGSSQIEEMAGMMVRMFREAGG